MNKKLKGIILTGILSTLVLSGCSPSKSKTEQNDISKNIEVENVKKKDENKKDSKQLIEFKNSNPINIDNYKEIDRKEADIDKDGDKEDIILFVKGERLNAEEAYVVVCKKGTKEVLTTFDVGGMACNIYSIQDENKDNIDDITISMSSGGTAGSCEVSFIYDSGEYISEIEYDSNDKVTQYNSYNEAASEVSEDKIQEVIQYLYNTLGESRNDIEYIYSPNDSYVSDESLKNDYYIFQILIDVNTENCVSLDNNIIVNKETMEIYNYYPDGTMEKSSK